MQCSAQPRFEEADFGKAHWTLHKPSTPHMHLTALSTGLKCRKGHQQLHLDPFQGYTALNLKKKSPFRKKVSKDLVSPVIYSLLESKNADESITVSDVIWFSLKGCTIAFRVSVSKGGFQLLITGVKLLAKKSNSPLDGRRVF